MLRFLPVVSLLIFLLFACNETGFVVDTDGDTDTNEIGEVEQTESDDEVVQICTPEQWYCYDEYSHWQCNEEGTDYTGLELCDADQLCLDGKCSDKICEKGKWYCYDEYSIMQCNDVETDFQNLQLCQPYEDCIEGKCTQKEKCEGGEWVCYDSKSRWQCNDNSNGWGNLEDCANGETCFEGECVSGTICTPNESKCYNNKATLTCNGEGTGYLDPELCATGSYCEDGKCVAENIDGDEDYDAESLIDGDEDQEIEYETEFEIDPNTVFNSCNNLSDDSLRNCLYNKIKDHNYLSYNGAKDAIFGDIDHQNGYVECVYTGRKAYINEPDVDGMNTEHTWPQSMGADNVPPRSDMHHLFPTDSSANSRRSNYPFGKVVTETWSEGGSKLGYDSYSTRVFEPRDQQKGDTARAIFYFAIRYQMSISYNQETALKQWNHDDPPDEYEKARNEAIYDYQQNYNPFVMRPDFVDMIQDF